MAALPALLCTILIFMDQQITAVIINRKEHKLKVRAPLLARPRPLLLVAAPWGPPHLMVCSLSPTERLRLSSGPAGGVGHVGRVLHHGPALVCRRHRPLHLSRQQPEGGVWLLCSGRTAQIPGHSGTADHRTHDLCPHGLFCLHDLSAEGEMCRERLPSGPHGQGSEGCFVS